MRQNYYRGYNKEKRESPVKTTIIKHNSDELTTNELKELILKEINEHKGAFTIQEISSKLSFYLNNDDNKTCFKFLIEDLDKSGYIINKGNGIYTIDPLQMESGELSIEELRNLILKTINDYNESFTIIDISKKLASYLNNDANSKNFKSIIDALKKSGYIINEGNEAYIVEPIDNNKEPSNNGSSNDHKETIDNSLNELEDFFDFDELSESESFQKYFNETKEVINYKYNDDYFELLEEDKIKATENIVKANEQLVWSIVKKYQSLTTNSYTRDDMFIEGEMGLIRAINKFDLSMGYQFSTYATYWIMQAITRGIPDQSLTIRIPVHMYENLTKLTKTEVQLEKELSREPTTIEISKRMDEPVYKVDRYKSINSQFHVSIASLDKPINEEKDTSLEQMIPNQQTSVEELVDASELKTQIGKLLSCFNEKESTIIKMRFGIDYDKTYTLEEVGKQFGVTRERIRQIEKQLLTRIRTSYLKNYISGWE